MKKTTIEVIAAVFILCLIIVSGSWFFHQREAWSWVDSFYFTVMTVTTVGYGDFVPTHDVSKVVTAIFSLMSIPLVLFALGVIFKNYFELRIGSIERKMREILTREKDLEEEIIDKK